MFWFDIADVLLPPVYQAIKDMYAYARTLDTELRESLVNMVLVRTNFFIQTCDEATLESWENLLNINVYPGESTDERREFILLYLNNRFPTTEPYVRDMMNGLFGEANYELEFDSVNPFNLKIHVYDTNYDKIKKFFSWFGMMCPAHIMWGAYHTENTQAMNYVSAGTTNHYSVSSQCTVTSGSGILYLGTSAQTFDTMELS